jgi:hypothetical protein
VTPDTALLAATALHAGFQLTVTFVVYPALREVPAERWATAHGAHTRRIAGVVVPVYLAVVAAGVWALSGPVGWAVALAVGGSALALVTTALVAAPLHGRLGREGPVPALLDRLLLADRVRLLSALLAAGAAVWAA